MPYRHHDEMRTTQGNTLSSSTSAGNANLPKFRPLNEEGIDKVRKMLVREGQEGVVMARPATYSSEPRPEETIIFTSFIAAILVLTVYQIYLVHLSPNSAGVMLSVALFRYFFVLRFAGKRKGLDQIEAATSCNFPPKGHAWGRVHPA